MMCLRTIVRGSIDESNTDPRFARTALRHRVMPLLEQSFPGFAATFPNGLHSPIWLVIPLGAALAGDSRTRPGR